MGDFGTILIVGIIFCFVSPNWSPLFKSFYFASLIGFLMIAAFCPESPKWLLLQGHQKEAIRVLNSIASLNRSPDRIPEDALFIEAAIAKNMQNTEIFNAD